MQGMAIVECSNLVKTYRQGEIDVHALRGVDLEVEPGGFVALSGPSGSGKTTTLNLIGGLDEPTSGKVVVDGQELSAMNGSQLAEMRLMRIGFIFQAYNLVPVLSAVENVEFVMLLQGVEPGERRQKAKDMLDQVGLEGKYDRRPNELSGGQQQRVAVARAMVSNPAIILADEPTANLDSTTGEGLLTMMRDMNHKLGVTFIFSTHDDMVMDFARRLVHIRDGVVADDQVKG